MTSPEASTPSWTLRDATPQDALALRALNAANEPEVGPLDDDRIELFLTPEVAYWVAELDGELVGMFVGVPEGVAYSSPMYAWFSERHDRLAYVDRIALSPAARGIGLADAIYDRWEQLALERGAPVVCAEVNVEPPNPRSLAFHTRRGFEQVAELTPYGDSQREAMLVKLLHG